jgi:hypothetical protein
VKTAAITHSLAHGYQLEITEIPLGWLVAGAAGELTLTLTGHVLCCGQPGWTYRVRWGQADEEGWTERSLGHLLFRAGQWLSGGITFRHEKTLASIGVTPEWVGEHFPDIREKMRFLEDGPDAMSVSFSGDGP